MFDYSRIDQIDPDFLEQYVDMTQSGADAFRCPQELEREIVYNGATYSARVDFKDALDILWNEYAYDLTAKWGNVKKNYRAFCITSPDKVDQYSGYMCYLKKYLPDATARTGRSEKPNPEGLRALRAETHCYLPAEVEAKMNPHKAAVLLNEPLTNQLTHEQVRRRVLCFVAMMARFVEDDALEKGIQAILAEANPDAPRGEYWAIAHMDLWNSGELGECFCIRVFTSKNKVYVDISKNRIAYRMDELSQESDLFQFPEGEGSGANPPKLKYATKAATEAADKKAEAPASWIYLPRKPKHIPVLVQEVGEKKSYAYYALAAVKAGDRVVIGYPYAEDKALPGNTFQHVGIVQESADKPELKSWNAVNLAYAFGQTVTKRDVSALTELMKHGYAERRNGWFGGADYHFGLKLDLILQGLAAQILAAVSVLVRSDLATAESVSQAKKLLQEMPVHKEDEALYDKIREFNKEYSNEYGFDGVAGSMLDEPELIRQRMEMFKCKALCAYRSNDWDEGAYEEWLKKNAYASQIKKRGYADTAQEMFYTLPVAPKADRLLSDYLNRCVLMEAVGVMMNCGLSTMLRAYLLACPPLFGCVKALTEYAKQKGVKWAVTLLEAYRKGDMDAIRNDVPQDEAPIHVKFTAPEKTGPVKRIGLEEDYDAEKTCWMQFDTEMQWAERAECSDAQRIAWRADAAKTRNELEKTLVKALPKKLEGKRFVLLCFDSDLAEILTQRIQAAGGDVLTEADGADYAVVYAKSANVGTEKEMSALHQAQKQAQLVSDRTLWHALPKRMVKA